VSSDSYGSQSMVAPLRRVAVRMPSAAFGAAIPADWHYHGKPDLEAARDEHAALIEMLEAEGAELIWHDADLPELADAMYVHDPVLVCDAGTIVLQMGKRLRRGEEEPLAATLESAGVPVHYRLHGVAQAEGGDLLWIDQQTLAVGQGFRTNAAALAQLDQALAPLGVTCIPVPLPVYSGADACLHLMSLISMIDDDLAVAYPALLPVPPSSSPTTDCTAIVPAIATPAVRSARIAASAQLIDPFISTAPRPYAQPSATVSSQIGCVQSVSTPGPTTSTCPFSASVGPAPDP
jgi:dimethylargininase